LGGIDMSEKAAVIYIGSSALYLKIGEKRADNMKILESLEYPLNLGHDTFKKDKISFEKVDETCRVLKGFLKLTDEYRIEKIKTVATTAIREAKNRDYILDQIKVKTGLQVEVLDDSEEKIHIYKGMSKKLKKLGLNDQQALMCYIGTGRLGVSLYSKGNIKYNQNIRIGSLKLSELLGKIQEKTDKFYLVLEEYLRSFTYMLQKSFPIMNISHFVVCGKEIEMIANLCEVEKEKESWYIPKDKFQNFYDQIKDKTPIQLLNMYNLSPEKSEILLPAMAIYKTVFNFTQAEKIIAPFVFLVDVLLYDTLYSEESRGWNDVFVENTIISAKSIGEKFYYNKKHAEVVTGFTLKIFDGIKAIHGLGDRERLLLEIAAILHDVGKYISLKRHYYHSYDIIYASSILGLNNKEIEIVANVARYHSAKSPNDSDVNYRKLATEDKVLVAKLAAILRLGDSLDRSHIKKFEDLKVNLEAKKLEVIGYSNENTLLEAWTFEQKSELFKEVFGIKAEFIKKRVK
jgi:exopolyphosphatase/guanosine-5'-triphosphate,3'-diphosphate pyrophosphatase